MSSLDDFEKMADSLPYRKEYVKGLESEIAAKDARIAELEAELSIVKHDLKETQTKVIPGLIKFARQGQLEEYLIALELHLKS